MKTFQVTSGMRELDSERRVFETPVNYLLHLSGEISQPYFIMRVLQVKPRIIVLVCVHVRFLLF